MRIIFSLLRKDFARVRRDKAALVLTFLVPFLLMFLFGQIFGVNNQSSGPAGIPFAVVNQSPNPAALKLLDALKAEKTFKILTLWNNDDKSTRPLTEDDLRVMMHNNDIRFAMVIPADLIREGQLGLHLRILSNPRNEIETQVVNGILQKTIFSNVPQLLVQSLQERAKGLLGAPKLDRFNRSLAGNIASNFGGDPEKILADIREGNFGLPSKAAADPNAATTAPATTDFLSRLVKIDNEQVIGKDVKSPVATRLVGGWAMQFLLFALTASAASLFHEKEHGLLQRLLSTPATRAHILWSKFLYGVCLGLIQLVVLFLAGRFLYGIDVEHHLGLLVLACAFAAAACTSFGMLLAAIAPSQEAVRGLSTLLILLMSAIGGAWFPVSIMPELIQRLSKLTLVYWSMQGFDLVLWANASLVELLPTLGILAAITAVVMAVAVWRFNRGNIFD